MFTQQAADDRSAVLVLDGISKRFGAVQALADVHLTAHAGEVVALVGDNGAGKSTLIKAIAGVNPIDSGQMLFDGRSYAPHTPAESTKAGIATVYQDLALCDNLDVVANLFLGLEEHRFAFLRKTSMERTTNELLSQLSVVLPDSRALVASLSGGQRQSVAIARALLGDPKLVVLDEPTAALGVEQTAEVLNLIERLRERGHAIIMVSHNLSNVFDVADRIVILRLGRNAGEFDVATATQEEVVLAMTGMVAGRAYQRAHRQRPDRDQSRQEELPR